MPWNYRVVAKDGQLAVHEVFYDNDGLITGFTGDPVHPRADTLEDLADEFERYRRALSEPVLDFHALEADAAASRRFQTP